MLNLDFTDEQEMLRDMVRGLCSELAPLQRVRELEDDPDGVARDLWARFGESGLCGMVVPEEAGGSGMSLLDGVVLYEEMGRSLAPLPHFVSCVMSAGSIIEAGAGERHRGLLADIASGATIATTAWLEPGSGFKPRGVQLTARRHGSGFVLDGAKDHVPYAAAADVLVVLARTGGRDSDIGLFVVPAGMDGVTLRQRMSISSDTQYSVALDSVALPAEARLEASDGSDGSGGSSGSGWDAWERAMHVGVILLAAQAVGGAAYALEISVEYAKTRRQFGKALAEFQAISHYLADARTELDGARLLVCEAAWAHDTGRSTARLAPMAKLFACRAFRDISAMAQQVFGGIGFTVDYDIQLFFRRAKQLQISWWDQTACEDRVADAVLGPA